MLVIISAKIIKKAIFLKAVIIIINLGYILIKIK